MTIRDRVVLLIVIVMVVLLGWWSWGRSECVDTALEGEFEAHTSNGPGFGTPITTGDDGAIYVCLITPDLQTIIAQKKSGEETWASTVLTPVTQNDPYHTQCSLAIDPAGYVHVVYNMHNTPWQYAISDQPNSINTMVFKGQYAGTNPGAGTAQRANCTGTCYQNWIADEPGIAAIPGNQITYPNFAYHQDGTVFLAFRECRYCHRSFFSREWSAGIVRYDHEGRQWSRVGNMRPWATDPLKVPLAIRLYGDWTGRLHSAWLWCTHYNSVTGSESCWTTPNFFSYAFSDDKGETWRQRDTTPVPLPVSPSASDVVIGPNWYDDRGAVGYHSAMLRLMSGPCRNPFLVIQPQVHTPTLGIQRSFVTGSPQQDWSEPRWLSYSPTAVFQDHQGVWTAISSGVRIHRSRDGFATQTLFPLEVAQGPYHFAVDTRLWERSVPQILRLYMHNSTTGRLTIWSVRFQPSCS